MSTPSAFISYSWDDPEHRHWVRDLAARLRGDGVNVTLDQWHAVLGDQLPAFMERAVRTNDLVLIICTPKYKARSDGRIGGVGYEGDIIQAEVFASGRHRKFVPILRAGQWEDAAPAALLGKLYVDLRGNPYNQGCYQDLVDTLLGRREPPPPLGPPPPITRRAGLARAHSDDVNVPCVVRITRQEEMYTPRKWYDFFHSSDFDKRLDLSVVEDGQVKGTIKNGGVLTYLSTPGDHTLEVTYSTEAWVPSHEGTLDTVGQTGRSEALRTSVVPGINDFTCGFHTDFTAKGNRGHQEVNLFLRRQTIVQGPEEQH